MTVAGVRQLSGTRASMSRASSAPGGTRRHRTVGQAPWGAPVRQMRKQRLRESPSTVSQGQRGWLLQGPPSGPRETFLLFVNSEGKNKLCYQRRCLSTAYSQIHLCMKYRVCVYLRLWRKGPRREWRVHRCQSAAPGEWAGRKHKARASLPHVRPHCGSSWNVRNLRPPPDG